MNQFVISSTNLTKLEIRRNIIQKLRKCILVQLKKVEPLGLQKTRSNLGWNKLKRQWKNQIKI